MASDSDQELWRVRPKGVSIWLLASVIAAASGGIVGAIFLYKNMALAQKDADKIAGMVRQYMEMPLREMGVHVAPDPNPGEFFFSLVKRYVVLGSRLPAYQRVVGWNTKEDVLAEAEKADATDVRSMIRIMDAKIAAARAELAEQTVALGRARAAVTHASDQSKALSRTLQKRLTSLLREITDIKRQQDSSEAVLQRKKAALAKARSEVQNKIDGLKKAIAKEKNLKASAAKKFKAQIAKLDQQIKQLKRVPPPKPGPAGNVLNVDLGVRLAVLNIGKNDGVRKGTEYDVFEYGKAGQKQYKGRLKIRSVDSSMSQATIVDLKDPRNPIISGDVLERRGGSAKAGERP